MEGFKFLIDNWVVIIACACCVCCVAAFMVRFFSMPTEKQIANVKEWLRYAVMECEKELGTKTGSAKLHMCYDLAIKQFPWIAQFVKFEDFSKWVDEALVWMREQLEKNEAVAQYVENKAA